MRIGRVRVLSAQKREQRRQGRRKAAARESKGRTVGRTEGSWVSDLAAIRQSILLCWACDAKWKGAKERLDYDEAKGWTKIWGGVVGKCDGCRQPGHQRRFYAHASISDGVFDR